MHILMIIIGIILICYITLTIYVSRKVILTEKLSYDSIWEYDKMLNNLPDDIRGLPYQSYQRTNSRGLKLNARLFQVEGECHKYIFLNHGNTCVYTGMLKYIAMLLSMGINVFAPDHSGRGDSEGKYNTYGYYEHKDSLEWLDYLYNIDKDAEVGVMGESMGGTISLLMASQDDRLKLVIEDCGFHNAYESVRYITGKKIGFLSKIIMPLVNLILYLTTGARLKSVDAIRAVDKIKIPLLIIHGMKDDKVLPESAFLIHDANPDNEIEIFEDAEHAQCYGSDRERYKNIISSFMERKGMI